MCTFFKIQNRGCIYHQFFLSLSSLYDPNFMDRLQNSDPCLIPVGGGKVYDARTGKARNVLYTDVLLKGADFKYNENLTEQEIENSLWGEFKSSSLNYGKPRKNTHLYYFKTDVEKALGSLLLGIRESQVLNIFYGV